MALDPGETEGIGNTEQWNGSAWTEVGDLNQVRYFADVTGLYTYGNNNWWMALRHQENWQTRNLGQ